MTTQNTSITFSAQNQSLWGPGYAGNFYISTGNSLIYDSGPQSFHQSWTAWGNGVSFTPYMYLRFGLVAWANLGTGGFWNASYEIDLNVDLPSATFGNTVMSFDFSDYSIVSAKISSKGFGGGEKGIGAGLDLVIGVEAGVRDITLETFWHDYDLGSFTLIPRIDKTINLISVKVIPKIEFEFIDGVKLVGRLPQGADAQGYSAGTTVVEGHGVSKTQFISLEADLDKLLTGLMSKFPGPVAAVGKILENTVFLDKQYEFGDGIITLEFTMVDIGASVGLALTEDVKLDIADPLTKRPDVRIQLTSDNGTPANTGDDYVVAVGKLGDVLQPMAPASTASGTATITADFTVNRASFSHKVGLAVVASLTIDILKGKLDGSLVPSALVTEFGPLFHKEFPEGGWDASLGTLFRNQYEVASSAFNVAHDTYKVFYAQAGVAPSGWDPTQPGAAGVVQAYFEANYKQQSAARLQYAKPGFIEIPDGNPPDNPYVTHARENPQYQFIWIGNFSYEVYLNPYNGSLVTVAPSVTDGAGTPIEANLLARVGEADFMGYGSSWQAMYQAAQDTAFHDNISYSYNGKTLEIASKADVVGRSRGDVLLYGAWRGDYFDGGANDGARHDVFIANFADTSSNTRIEWDLAKSIAEENDAESSTVGGITLANGVTVRHVEAAVLITGSADDYLVAGVQSDVFVTGGGNDYVKLVYYVPGANGSGTTQQVDLKDDYVRLDSGDDTVVVELGNIPDPVLQFTDYLFGGSGVDRVFVRSGMQGLRYDAKFTVSGVDQGYLFAGNGVGASASHADLTSLLSVYSSRLAQDFDGFQDPGYYSVNHFLLLNGGPNQGRIEISSDVESVSVYIPENSSDGMGDDLLVYMGGSRYDGGAGGVDTFAADFSAWETLLGTDRELIGTHGGLQLILDNQVSYFGDTIIQNVDRLHVKGTSAPDVIYGGTLGDYIDGGYGDDFIFGGLDSVADQLFGGFGDDRVFWINSGIVNDLGTDTVDGGYGDDSISIRYNVDDSYLDNSTYGNTYQFFDAIGQPMRSGSTQQFTADSADYMLVDALAFSRSATSQKLGFQGKVTFTNIEHIDITGSNSADDLMIYQGGDYYDGGENLTGLDGDVFIADFSGQSAGIDFHINDVVVEGEEDGYWLGNEVFIKGIDRGVIQAGDGLDILTGGRFADILMGGGGADILYGGDDNSRDILEGGEGSDTFYWYTDAFDSKKAGGSDVINGGTNADQSYEKDHLIMAGGTGPSRVAIQTFDAGLGDWVDTLPNNGGSTRGYAWVYSSESVIHTLAENSLNPQNLWEYYNSSVGQIFDEKTGQVVVGWEPTKQRDGRALTYQQIESVDMGGSDAYDDIIVYQHGVGYVGGERSGDADLFVADLREFSENLSFDVDAGSGMGYDIGQGTYIADFERLHLLLGSGNDMVKGGELDDVVYAGAGNDRLSGGHGNDHYDGGAGNDFYEHAVGSDYFDGGEGTDVVLLSADADPFSVSFFGAAGDLIGARLTMAGSTPAFADFGAVFSISTDDYIVVDHGANALKYQRVEEVQMAGGEQNDVLIAGTSLGILFGGAGGDALIGRAGNDFMSGGPAEDIYVFGPNFGQDVVFGESAGGGTLMFTEATQADLSYALDGIDLVVTVAANSVRVRDYFANDKAAGLDFTFQTTDATFSKDFSILGAPDPLPRASGVDFLGTSANNDIRAGTTGADTIRAFGGDDAIQATAGADVLDGGAGADAVSYADSNAAVAINLLALSGFGGYAEGDLLFSIEHLAGSAFDDLLKGNNLFNAIGGGDGADTIFGVDGDDALSGGAGDDQIDGGAGGDVIYGNDGADTLSGGDGTDYLSGGADADELDGGDGADVLNDGAGNDVSRGNAGNDMFIYVGGLDDWDGGEGDDTADFEQFEAALQVDLSAASDVFTRDALDLVAESGTLRTLVRLAGMENVMGSVYADHLVGDAKANQLEGSLGDDWITGHAGADTLLGGAGMDKLDYSQEAGGAGVAVWMGIDDAQYAVDTYGDTDILSGFEWVIGTSKVDQITGNAQDNIIWGGGGDDDYLDGRMGNDLIYGEGGADLIYGGVGDDMLIGGDGDDTVYGESGDDLIIGSNGLGDDFYDGGEDFDTVSYAGTSVGIVVNLNIGLGQASGSEIGTDQLRDIENIIGGTGNDSMTGNDGNNSFSYYGGLDTYDGAGGSDTVSFSHFQSAVQVDLTQADKARTRDNTDLLTGTGRTLVRLTSVENAIGSNYNDELSGDAFENILAGGGGDDVIHGGLGNDTYMGGDGNDVFFNLPGNGSDQFDGGDGIDTLDYSGYTTYVRASLVDGDLDESNDNGDDTLISMERLVGTNFGDYLWGNDFANIIQGGTGDDLIQAADGDDLIVYLGGYDYLYGEGGQDTLDFSLFTSAISLDFNSQDAVSTRDTDRWDVGVAREIIYIYGFDVENAIGSDFNDKLIGTDGVNLFSGGMGDDLILVMGGDDMVNYEGGVDTIDGGEGVDTVNYSTFRFAVDVDFGAATPQTWSRNGPTVASGNSREKITEITNFENMIGSMFSDKLTGNSQSNTIMGLDGDDTLRGGDGSDTLEGGDGKDTAAFDGLRSAYVVTAILNGFSVAGGSGGADTLIGIEFLQFDDQMMVLGDFDTTPPTIALSSNDASLTRGETATLSFTLSEASSDFTAADVAVSGGALSGFAVTADPLVYRATFTPAAGSTTAGVLSVASGQFTDAAGNANADGADANNSVTMTVNTVAPDTTAPTIALSSNDASLTQGESATISFTLSEAASDFTAADVAVSGGALSGFAVTADPMVYRATFTPAADSTTAGVLSVASGQFTDAAGNANADGADANNSVTMTVNTVPVDTTPPVINNGTANSDTVTGNRGNDTLSGQAGNDTLSGGLGNDTLDGGVGTDTAVYSERQAAYTLSALAGGYGINGPDGTDTFTSIERLQFLDTNLAFDLDGNAGQTYRLYQASFNRTPDLAGLGGWIAAMDGRMTPTQVATSFMASAEFQSLYGSSTTNAQFVSLLYTNALHRSADAGGLAGWVDELASGRQTRAQVLVNFSESAENKASVLPAITNGIVYATTAQAAGPAKGQAFTGTTGDDSLIGSVGNDTVTSNAGNDNINAGFGNDSITAGPGNDTINGGGGLDTAVYSGKRATYTTANVNATLTVSGGTDGNDTLTNIERLKFDDAILAFDTSGNAGQTYRLYQAAFNRTPDKGGLTGWVNGVDSGMTMLKVAAAFIESGEFKALYGTSPTDAEFVNLLYTNALHRSPDQGGLDYWVNQLSSSSQTREQALLGFSESVENQASLIGVIQGGIELVVG